MSKTLAVQLINDTLNKNNIQKFKKKCEVDVTSNIKSIYISSFQCSKHSRASNIENQWNDILNMLDKNSDSMPVLLLDEIGLAEESPHRPLKVLRKNSPLSFLFISFSKIDSTNNFHLQSMHLQLCRVCLKLSSRVTIKD